MDSAQPGMNAAQQFVVVKAPLERVYEQWSRIEDLPKFITPLRHVQRIDATHFSYTWRPDGEDPFDLRSSKSLPESGGVSAQF